jgi:hypothetical protein
MGAQDQHQRTTEQDGNEADRPDTPLQGCRANSGVVAEDRLVGSYHDRSVSIGQCPDHQKPQIC